MKITESRHNRCYFKEIFVGDVFKTYDNVDYYIKTYDSYKENNELFNCISLNDGSFGSYITPETVVIKVDCELVIK